MKCRLCGKGISEIKGWLTRVNPKGITGVWECRPSCNANLTQKEAFMAAIKDKKQ